MGGPQAFGFDSFQQMWRNFTVILPARNPFSRAASAYDYLANVRHLQHTQCRAFAAW